MSLSHKVMQEHNADTDLIAKGCSHIATYFLDIWLAHVCNAMPGWSYLILG